MYFLAYLWYFKGMNIQHNTLMTAVSPTREFLFVSFPFYVQWILEFVSARFPWLKLEHTSIKYQITRVCSAVSELYNSIDEEDHEEGEKAALVEDVKMCKVPE